MRTGSRKKNGELDINKVRRVGEKRGEKRGEKKLEKKLERYNDKTDIK